MGMKTFATLLMTFMAVTSLRADSADSFDGVPRLGPTMAEVAPILDKLMERNAPDHRFPDFTVWTLYGQNDTSVYLTHDLQGNIYRAFFQFYLGHDKKREEHYNQCLPIARFLIHTFMKKERPSIKSIDDSLREIEHTKTIKTFREPDRVMYFRYKTAGSLPEIEDGYRCFRIEIGGPESTPSEDR
jgi:hypothetical protein